MRISHQRPVIGKPISLANRSVMRCTVHRTGFEWLLVTRSTSMFFRLASAVFSTMILSLAARRLKVFIPRIFPALIEFL